MCGAENKSPFFSVIISVHAKYGSLIVECIGSVLRQTYQNFELILVAASYPYILDGIEDSRIKRLFADDDENYTLKKNIGIEASRGEYLVFVDCDDLLSPRFLERAFNLVEHNQTDCVIFGATRDMHAFLEPNAYSDPVLIRGQEDVRRLCLSRYASKEDSRSHGVILDSVWGKAFSADVIKRYHVRFPDKPVRADDVLFGNRFYLSANSICLDPSYISYFWRPSRVSEMSNFNSAFYDVEGFIIGLLAVLSPVPPEEVDNLDKYFIGVVRGQFGCLVEACNNRSIKISEAASFLHRWMPRHSRAFGFLIRSQPRFSLLLRLQFFKIYFAVYRACATMFSFYCRRPD